LSAGLLRNTQERYLLSKSENARRPEVNEILGAKLDNALNITHFALFNGIEEKTAYL